MGHEMLDLSSFPSNVRAITTGHLPSVLLAAMLLTAFIYALSASCTLEFWRWNVIGRQPLGWQSAKSGKRACHNVKRSHTREREWLLPQAKSLQTICEKDAPEFRPFRWGEYKVTMGIRFIPETQWFELYKSYPAYIRLRELRHAQRGKECVDVVADPKKRNLQAALEAARSIAAYLAAQYPEVFRVEVAPHALHNGSGNFGENVRAVERLRCDALSLPFKRWTLNDLEDTRIDGGEYCNPMQVAGELVPDDLALLLPDEDGEPDERGALHYRLIAGSICTAGFWRLSDKLNCTLQQIHLAGKVPQYAERLRDPLDRFFTKMEPGGDRLAERNNYFFQIVRRGDSLAKVHQLRDGTLIPDVLADRTTNEAQVEKETKARMANGLDDRTELTWGLSTNGPEHLYDASLKGPRADVDCVTVPSENGPVDLSTPVSRAEDVVMRTERQTLRKLPKSGAVLFTIHTHMVPLSIMAEEPGVPGRLAYAMRHWPEDVAWYKAASLYRDVVLPYLDAKHERQVHDGIIESQSKEEERSRRSYPL